MIGQTRKKGSKLLLDELGHASALIRGGSHECLEVLLDDPEEHAVLGLSGLVLDVARTGASRAVGRGRDDHAQANARGAP